MDDAGRGVVTVLALCSVAVPHQHADPAAAGRGRHSYDCLCLNKGALPPLALCLLRCRLLYDGTNSALVLLRELDVPWDLALVSQRCYTAESKTQDHIAMPLLQTGQLPGAGRR